MDAIDNSEAWRQIPPEEKIALMSRAHGNAIMACLIAVITGGTLAVGLHNPWLLWSSLIFSPLIFQFTAGKAWRDLRPKMMLEYLGARSAARRYAFTANSQDLGVALIFRGECEELFDQDQMHAALEAIIRKNKVASVWITLFNDALVMLEEQFGGARCACAAVINDKMKVESKSLDDAGDYSANKEIIVTLAADRQKSGKRYKITSEFPAALIVFEKKLMEALTAPKVTLDLLENATQLDEDAQLLGIE